MEEQRGLERSRFRYLLVYANGEPADPAVFVSEKPPPAWEVGDIVLTPTGLEYRIIDMESPVEGFPAEWSADFNGLWTVEPL